MLKILRDNVKFLSWILWVVIGLFVLFVFVDFGTGIGGRNTTSWAAKVGSTTISSADFQRAERAMDSRFRQMYGEQYTPEVAKQLQLPLQALNQAVINVILLREARRIGLRATDAEVRDKIMSEGAFHDDQCRFIGE